jgi:Spy/CpxP family protein refolding chaperone
MHRGMRAQKMAERLNLTAEQKQKLEQIHSRQKERMQGRREAARAEHQALQAELRKDNPNRAEIQRLTTAMQQRHAQAMQERIAGQLEFNQSLTPEQRVELNKMAAERAQKRSEMRQRREQRQQQKLPEQPAAPQTSQQ